MQTPRTGNDEKLLHWNPTGIGNWASRISAVKSGKYRRGSAEGNPRRACQSRNGDYHLSEIQRASA